jgi:hypothetical protein
MSFASKLTKNHERREVASDQGPIAPANLLKRNG